MKIPVLLITFNRPDHTKRTIDALRTQQPPLVYVYQDGPRDGNELDKTKCELVKQVINTSIDWPCELHFDVSVNNRGCRDSVIYAITEVLKCHDCVIVVEDDIVTSPAFYSFMCLALDYYKDRKSVFSVSGHSHSPSKFKVPNDYPYDVFASPRLFNSGWGTWKDRWEQTDWSFLYYDELMMNPYEQDAFNRGGDDLTPMLVDEKSGKSSAWDIQFAFAHFQNHAVSIVPCESYTHNIGMDGTGTHCGALDDGLLDYPALNQNPHPRLIDTLYFDSRIINMLHSIFARKNVLYGKRLSTSLLVKQVINHLLPSRKRFMHNSIIIFISKATRKLNYLWKCRRDRFSYINGKDNVVDTMYGIKVRSRVQISGTGNIVIIENGAVLMNSLVKIQGNNNVVILHSWSHVSGAELWIEDNDCRLEIGTYTFVGHHSHLACTENGRSLIVGNDGMISSYVQIRTGDSHSLFDSDKTRINQALDVKIGNHVWIGEGAKVLKGVTLQDNTVVATGAIVTKSVPEKGVLLAGCPAKVIKENISWDTQRV